MTRGSGSTSESAKDADVKRETPRPDDGWKDVASGGIISQGGNAQEYETGDWRSLRPVLDLDACVQCRLCWVYCPDSAIEVDDEGEVLDINYFHCKGCGICASECPTDAIEMVPEEES